jgi:hypothetical protein
MLLARLKWSAAVAVFMALLAALCAGCSSNANHSVQNAPCATGTFCVRLGVNGAISGTLNTTSPPANFQPECAIVPASGQQTWVSHQFGRLGGRTWSVDVEAPGYKSPGAYPVTVSLSDHLSGEPGATYFGHGTATLRTDGTAAKLSARLNEIPAARHQSVSVAGTLSCPTLVRLH